MNNLMLGLIGKRFLRILLFLISVFLCTWIVTRALNIEVYKRYDVQIFYNLATYIALGIHGVLLIVDIMVPPARRLFSDTLGFMAFTLYILIAHYSVYPMKSLMFILCMSVSIYVVYLPRLFSNRRKSSSAPDSSQSVGSVL